MNSPLVIGYWPFHGIAAPAFLLCAYFNRELKLESAGTDWDKKKFGMGLDFPNLPYLKDKDFKVTESTAIFEYIAKTCQQDFAGKDLIETAKMRMLEGVVIDIRNEFASKVMAGKPGTNFKPVFEGIMNDPKSKGASKMKSLSDFLGNNKFFMGRLTMIDFYIAYFVYLIDHMSHLTGASKPFAKHRNLQEHVDTVFKLKGVRDYISKEFGKKSFLPPDFEAKLTGKRL